MHLIYMVYHVVVYVPFVDDVVVVAFQHIVDNCHAQICQLYLVPLDAIIVPIL